MGKRSNFTRRAHDAYDTPLEAVRPLIPHLPHDEAGVSFWEPCAGQYALVDALHGLWPTGFCAMASDIVPRAPAVLTIDALTVTPYVARHEFQCDLIISNPPWTREILHPMIEHFAAIRPTWLLFDADWMHTKQAAPYLPHLRKIVSVGRVKWIPDSPHTGKENAAWHLFDAHGYGAAVFVGRSS